LHWMIELLKHHVATMFLQNDDNDDEDGDNNNHYNEYDDS